MSKQLAKKVKLPKEENNGNKNKGPDPKDESSSTPDREGERTDVPEYFARPKESFFYDEKEETIFRMQQEKKQLKSTKTTRSKL
jgi:hypothetical protein